MTVNDLLHDHPHPMTLAEIARETGLSRREVELEVQRLRLEGLPVVGGSDGVRLTADPDELETFADRLRGRIATQSVTLHAVERAASRLRGVRQERFW